MESGFLSSCQEINVFNPQIKDKAFSKHVSYWISGYDSQGQFQALRRYKEFNALRNTLMTSWPGCFVPTIPPKKTIVITIKGNLQADFIERRRYLFELFLRQIIQINYIYDSEEFQQFIRGPEDYIKTLSTLKKHSLIEISQKYQSIFTNIPTSELGENIIADSETYFKFTLSKLESFSNMCKKNQVHYELYNKYLSRTFACANKIQEKYQMYGKSYPAIPWREEVINPFDAVFLWTQSEMLDFQGILDVINQRGEIIKAREKIEEKVENEHRNLVKTQSGKKSLSQKINKKSNSDCVAEAEKTLEEAKNELEYIKKLEEIVTTRLVGVYLQNFKQRKVEGFGMMMERFIDASVSEMDVLLKHAGDLPQIFSQSKTEIVDASN